ncbi:AraC family transcriptional regulator, partial [Romboutsia ilealis]|nr:AraC family transcriptional regulator [Romboutsia ilealis]
VQNEFYSAGEAREYMQKIVSDIFHHLREQDEKQYSRKVLLILEYIQQHYAENISLQDIAEAVQLSEGHTRKCFKQEIGTTVVDY